MKVDLTIADMVHLLNRFSYTEQLTILSRSNPYLLDGGSFRRFLRRDERTDDIANEISTQVETAKIYFDPYTNIAAVAASFCYNAFFTSWLWRFIIDQRLKGYDVPDLHVEIAKGIRDGYPDPRALHELITLHPDPTEWEIGPYLDAFFTREKGPLIPYRERQGPLFPNEAELQAFEPGPGRFAVPAPEDVQADLARFFSRVAPWPRE